MSISGSTSSSYVTSLSLVGSDFYHRGIDALMSMSPEAKLGTMLAIGTFVLNWYYKARADHRAARAEAAGKLVEVQTDD